MTTPNARERAWLRGAGIALGCALFLTLLVLAGCAGTKTAEEVEPTGPGYGMGGIEQDIVISRAALENKPAPWVLDTPENAVRSYLDWVSYAYRIGESQVATPTMTSYQEVRVDAYTQMQLQKSRLLDQTLESIAFGAPSQGATSTLLPAREKWSYRYVSIKVADQTLEGPYTAEYDTVYTLVSTERGWVVDAIAVTPLSEIK